jgi:glyoxylase-like metal-dependent hydrolase (beta-lactamase superfamily II)
VSASKTTRTNPLNRRKFLTAAAAGLAACALPARAATPPFSFKHGAFEIIVVSDGHLVLPTSFLAPEAPKPERDAVLKAAGHDGTQYNSPTNVTLIRAGNELILIDMGSGDRFMPTAGKLAENLTAAGIDKAKITKVVFTHGHPDHLWGLLDDLDDLVLPNAAYFVPAAEWDFWNGADAMRGLPAERQGFVTGARRNFARIKERVKMLQPGEDIVTGLRALGAPGHTQGHIALEAAGGEGLIVAGDALTHPLIAFQYPGWKFPGDHEPDRAIGTRRRLLDRMAADRTKLIGFHLPYPGLGRVERSGGVFRFVSEP